MSFQPFSPFRPFGGDGAVLSLDPDADAYIRLIQAAGADLGVMAEEVTTKKAISDAFIQEKDEVRWDLHKRWYMPMWGVPEANAICLRSRTSASWIGDVIHQQGYSKAVNNTGYLQCNLAMTEAGLTPGNGYLLIARKTAVRQTYQAFIGLTAPGRVIAFGGNYGFCRSDWGNNNTNIFTTTDYVDNIPGIFVSRRTPSQIIHGFRNGTVYASQSANTPADGAVLSAPARIMQINSTFWDPSEYFGVSWGVDGAGSNDSAYTANFLTLWETCSGLSLP